MPADQSLAERRDEQRERVIEAMDERDKIKRRLDENRDQAKRKDERVAELEKQGASEQALQKARKAAQDAADDRERAAKDLAKAKKDLDEKRDRLVEIKDELDDRRRKKREEWHFSPGSPYWGGSDQILERRSEPYVRQKTGAEPNSAKRPEDYGNPGSDHHTSQVWASARDWPLANRHDLRNGLASATAGRSVAVSDYQAFYFVVEGHEFRGQIIAGTHGTGPHLHEGVELVG